MGLVSYSRKAKIDYVPKCGGNRRDKKPTIVTLRFIPFEESQRIARVRVARLQNVADPAEQTQISQDSQKELFVDNVIAVRNFDIIEEDGSTREPANIEEFYKASSTELVAEILDALEDSAILTEGQSKNFERVSGTQEK